MNFWTCPNVYFFKRLMQIEHYSSQVMQSSRALMFTITGNKWHWLLLWCHEITYQIYLSIINFLRRKKERFCVKKIIKQLFIFVFSAKCLRSCQTKETPLPLSFGTCWTQNKHFSTVNIAPDLPVESDGPWKGSNFCLLAFGGPSTRWSAIAKSVQSAVYQAKAEALAQCCGWPN